MLVLQRFDASTVPGAAERRSPSVLLTRVEMYDSGRIVRQQAGGSRAELTVSPAAVEALVLGFRADGIEQFEGIWVPDASGYALELAGSPPVETGWPAVYVEAHVGSGGWVWDAPEVAKIRDWHGRIVSLVCQAEQVTCEYGPPAP